MDLFDAITGDSWVRMLRLFALLALLVFCLRFKPWRLVSQWRGVRRG